MVESNELEATERHLKNVKLAMEFKYLTRQAPAGVYLLPELNNIRILHGVIFVRRGLYADGVFRFRIDLPATYNDANTHPVITFTPPVFNPFIDMETGILDLTVEESLKEWQPDKHFIITAVTFLKKSFYAKSYDGYSRLPNEQARQIFNTDKDLFLKKVMETVEDSMRRVYDPQPPNCTMIFTEPKPAHESLMRGILANDSSSITERDALVRATADDIDNLNDKLLDAVDPVEDLSNDNIIASETDPLP